MNYNQHIIGQKFGVNAIIGCHNKEGYPVISVIIPTFNCLAYLPKALKSVQQQQFKRLEMIVIDDDSTDNTWAYLTLASLCDKRIRIIKSKRKGVAAARNQGISIAQGQYIAFLDADDYWLKGKLDKQLNFHLQHPKATLSFTNYRHIDENQQDLGDCFSYWPRFARLISHLKRSEANHSYHLLENNGLGDIFAENVIGTSTVLINKNNIPTMLAFDTDLLSAEDWDLWLKCAKYGPIGFTMKVDMIYLMRKNSETSKMEARLKSLAIIINRHYRSVLTQSPTAMLHSLSRLVTGYAEYYRPTSNNEFWLKRKVRSIQACLLHSLAFLLSPSYRVFRAMLADVKKLLTF